MTPLDIAWTLLKQARLPSTPQEVQRWLDLQRASEPQMTLEDYEAEQAWREGLVLPGVGSYTPLPWPQPPVPAPEPPLYNPLSGATPQQAVGAWQQSTPQDIPTGRMANMAEETA